MAKTITPRSRSSWVKKGLLIVAYLVPLVGLGVFGGVYYNKYQDLRNQSPDQLAQTQVDQTLAEIGKLYSLPKDEKPVVATVKDKEAYKKQYPNFGDANNGDVLVIYTKAELAILYRPAEKRLIKVGPVSVNNEAETSQSAKVKVIGSATNRQTTLSALTGKQITATDGGDAKGQQLTTVVVDVSGKFADQAKTIATALDAQVGDLPAGEDRPSDADILVVAGAANVAP